MIALVLGLALASAPAPASRAYALIVANNAAFDGGLAPLKYADDDGAKYFELLSLVTADAEVLSVLDADSQRVFPNVAKVARAPTARELERTAAKLFEAIAADERAGLRTTFYFVYVGHGSITESGEGAMHLLDARFTRSDLFQKLISRSPARINHVIIDACNAYLMVARRGDHAAEDAAIDQFLKKEDLARYAGTGVLVSTSKAEDVHEWSRFEAGIFSHEVRSALAGGADVDGDGAVTYDEMRAFLSAANARVTDPKAKLDAYVKAPAVRIDEPLFDKKDAKDAARVVISSVLSGRRWLEDDRGVRYADLNIASDGAVALALVPSGGYFLRNDVEEIRLPVEAMAAIDAGALPREPHTLAHRGSETLTFQRDLFAVPFGRAYYEGFRARIPIEDELRSTISHPRGGIGPRHYVAGGLAIGAVASLATGIGFGLDARSKAAEFRSAVAPDAELMRLENGSRRSASAANILYAVGGGMIAGAVVTWLLFD